MCHHPNYGCEQHFYHAYYPSEHHQRGCCCGRDYVPRRFLPKEEIIEELEEYLKQLKAEAKGVQDRIAELREED